MLIFIQSIVYKTKQSNTRQLIENRSMCMSVPDIFLSEHVNAMVSEIEIYFHYSDFYKPVNYKQYNQLIYHPSILNVCSSLKSDFKSQCTVTFKNIMILYELVSYILFSDVLMPRQYALEGNYTLTVYINDNRLQGPRLSLSSILHFFLNRVNNYIIRYNTYWSNSQVPCCHIEFSFVTGAHILTHC